MKTNTSENPLAVAYTTVADVEAARHLASILISEKVAACVSILPQAESHYMWKGQVETEQECLLMIKTLHDKFNSLEQTILKHHPYECPELILLPVVKGYQPYLDWAQDQLQ